MLTRRQFLLGLAGAGVAGAGTVAYGRGIEAHWIDVTEKAVGLPPEVSGKAPLRIAHLSDLHASRWAPTPYLRDAFRKTLEGRPDIICITGDFFTCREHWDDAEFALVLRELSTVVPTFACVGNHDGGPYTAAYEGSRNLDRINRVFEASGIIHLHNQSVDVRVRDRTLRLVGLGDLCNADCRPEKAFSASPSHTTLTVVLSHNPDSKEVLLPYPWHLMLSGHTHGGQCGLPFVGSYFAPVRDKDYLAGLYDYEGRKLHITRGVGNLHGVRILCRPEVSFLTLA